MYMPKTLIEAIEYYGDEQRCIDTVAALRWPDGTPICPKCGAVENGRKHYWLAAQKRWKCYQCRKQFSVKVDSIFEESPLSLRIWLTAMWMLINCKNGVSSHEIARECGISQKSAWHLLHRIRHGLGNEAPTLIGGPAQIVECDETFIGGKITNKHVKDRERMQRHITMRDPKTPVMGMLDREARQVRAKVIPYVRREVLQQEILDNISRGSKVFTDGEKGYQSLAESNYVHDTVNHVYEYVRGEVHTNGIENFWSLLKRSLKGTYVAVEPFHLDRYVGEQVFRFNNRATKENPLTNADRFALALSKIAGKRLPWAVLTGQVPGTC